MVDLGIERGEGMEYLEGEQRVRRSDRLRTAKRVKKLGGIEYFQANELFRTKAKGREENHPLYTTVQIPAKSGCSSTQARKGVVPIIHRRGNVEEK